jgi:hypothetical protein
VITVVDEFRGRTPKSKCAAFLAEHFSAIFTVEPERTSQLLSKLSLRAAVPYIGDDREVFASAARAAIYKYSEVDLSYHETNEIADSLVDLIYRKSKEPLGEIQPHELQARIGVALDDLLRVLSISRSVYDALRGGEDPKALKTASILQRWLKAAGATDEMIEYASRSKVSWDGWLRRARHIYTPFDMSGCRASRTSSRCTRCWANWAKNPSAGNSRGCRLSCCSVQSVRLAYGGDEHGLRHIFPGSHAAWHASAIRADCPGVSCLTEQ